MATRAKLWSIGIVGCLAALIVAALVLPQSFRLTAFSDIIQCVLLLSGTICFAACGDAACCSVRSAARKRNAASVEVITAAAIHPILFTIRRPRKLGFAALLRPNYTFLFTTSSMLDPKSLSMTVAVFLPGAPVTDPPGNVVAPV